MNTTARTLLTLLSAGALLLGLSGCGQTTEDRSVSVGATARPGPLSALLASISTRSVPEGLFLSDGHRTVLVDGADLTLSGLALGGNAVDGFVAALVDHVQVALPLDGQVVPVARAAAPAGRYGEVRLDGGASVEIRGVADGRRFTFTAWLPEASALPLIDEVEVEVGAARGGQLTLALDLARILAPSGRLPRAADLAAVDSADDLALALSGYEDDDRDGACEPGDDHGEDESEHESEHETGHEAENENESEDETENEDPADHRGRDRN
jgi:hypothetical protein